MRKRFEDVQEWIISVTIILTIILTIFVAIFVAIISRKGEQKQFEESLKKVCRKFAESPKAVQSTKKYEKVRKSTKKYETQKRYVVPLFFKRFLKILKIFSEDFFFFICDTSLVISGLKATYRKKDKK